MNICHYYDRLEIENGELVRVVNAVPRAAKKSHLSLDVYKEYESGRCQCKNLYSSMYGYRVAFSGEVTSLYHNGSCSFIQEFEDFGETSKIPAFYYYSGGVDEISRKLVLDKYPDFKYVMKKWNGTIAQTIHRSQNQVRGGYVILKKNIIFRADIQKATIKGEKRMKYTEIFKLKEMLEKANSFLFFSNGR